MKNCIDLKIKQTVEKELRKWAKENKKSIWWFRYAKKTKYGYRFLANKETQWEILQEIADKIAQKYPQYTTGQIVDLLSELVNTRVV